LYKWKHPSIFCNLIKFFKPYLTNKLIFTFACNPRFLMFITVKLIIHMNINIHCFTAFTIIWYSKFNIQNLFSF
jgi:hypothetical protein